jgi:hypothetical protein
VPPVPHYLSPTELVVEIDFVRRWMLVGELARRNEPGTVCRHYRWRFDGKWEVDSPGRVSQPRPAMDAEAHEWRHDARVLTKSRSAAPRHVVIQYEPSYVVVPRGDLVKALDSIRKLTGKSLGVDGLLTLHVHSRGLSLCSHGKQSMRIDLACDDEARDGLGTVVVLGEALRAVVKDAQPNLVQVRVDARGAVDRSVHVGALSVWTVNAAPLPLQVTAAKPEPVDIGLTAAIARALVFASCDETRPNLNCVMLDGRGDHVRVVATDGHRLYRERVAVSEASAGAGFGTRKFTLSRAALTSLRPGKRSGSYRFALYGDDVVIACDGRTVTCAPSGVTFPPYDQVILPGLHSFDVPRGVAIVKLSPESVAKLRGWTRVQAAADLRKEDGNRYPVCMRIDAEGTVRLRVAGVDSTAEVAGEIVEVADGLDETEWFLLPGYWLEALENVNVEEPTHVAVGKELDPVYLFDSTRIVCTMPTRF